MIRCPSCGHGFQPDRGDQITVGDLHIDFRTRQVTLGGELVPLARQTFQVLAVLASDAGRVFTFRAIYEAAWNRPVNGTDPRGIVRTQIHHLLSALGPDAPVQNVRGVGYRLGVN